MLEGACARRGTMVGLLRPVGHCGAAASYLCLAAFENLGQVEERISTDKFGLERKQDIFILSTLPYEFLTNFLERGDISTGPNATIAVTRST